MKPFVESEQGTLYKETLTLLNESPLTPIEMHRETGLPFYWIKDLRAGKSKGPSVNRIQYLYEYLSKKQLVI